MKNLIMGLLILQSLPSFAQMAGQGAAVLTGEIYTSGARINADAVAAAGIRILPMTVNISQLISSGDMQSLSVSDFRASLISGSAYITRQTEATDMKDFKSFVGINGEVLSLDKRRIFLKDGIESFYSLDVIKLEAAGMFSLGDQVFLQMKVYGSIGAPQRVKDSNLFKVSETEVNEFISQGYCIGCEHDVNSSFKGDLSYKWGQEVEISYKKFAFNLSNHSIFTSTQNQWSQTNTSSETGMVTSRSVDNLSKGISQRDTGMKVSYRLTKDSSLNQVAIFAGLNLISTKTENFGANNLEGNNNGYYYKKSKPFSQETSINNQSLISAGVKIDLGMGRKKKNR